VVAGTLGTPGFAEGLPGTGRLNYPIGLRMRADGTVLVADRENHAIRQFTLGGPLATLAGNPAEPDWQDGPGQAARFWNPIKLDLDAAGNAYVVERGNPDVRLVTPDGTVTTVVGAPPSAGLLPGPLPASLPSCLGIQVEAGTGNLYLLTIDALLKVTF